MADGWRLIYIALLKGLAHWLNTFRYIIMAVVSFVVLAMVQAMLLATGLSPLSEHASLWLTVSVAYLIVIGAVVHHQATAEGSDWLVGAGNGALLLAVYAVLAVFPRLAAKGTWDEFMNSFGLFGFITMPLLILAPPRLLLQRLAFLLVGLLILVCINVATSREAVCQKIPMLPSCSRP